jgi:chromosomal replication initiation ATPase DnaA
MGTVEWSAEELEARQRAALAPRQLRLPALEVDPEEKLDAESAARAIAKRFGISYELMMSHRRGAPLPRARREVYLMLKRRGWSYPAIARFVGRRDHTTIMVAIDKTPQGRERAIAGSRWAP